MLKIGITGEMGSGKSYISNLFAEQKNIPIYNCDKNAKMLMVTNDKLKEDVKKHFGENIYDGNVFKNLSSIVFDRDEQSIKNLKILSELIHPYIYEDIDNFCNKNQKESVYCLIESAILYENKMEKNLDAVIYVSVPLDIRKKRAMDRDNITGEEYDNRMKTQLSPDFKNSKCNYLIYNDGKNDMKARIDIIHDTLLWDYIRAYEHI